MPRPTTNQITEYLVRDTDDGPGWSAAVDPDRAPGRILQWLGQLYGVRVTPGDATDPDWVERARDEIRNAAGARRGTPGALIGAVAATLTGTKHVTLLERYGSAYRFTVRTDASETPDPAATEVAMRSQKPAGIVAQYVTSDSPLIDEGTLTIDAVTAATPDNADLDDIT